MNPEEKEGRTFIPKGVTVSVKSAEEMEWEPIGTVMSLTIKPKKTFMQKIRERFDKFVKRFGYERKIFPDMSFSFSCKLSRKQMRKLKRGLSDIKPL